MRTLGLRTSLELDGYRALVREHEDCIEVRTPTNPGYYFGNALMYDRAPQAGDARRWPEQFERFFADAPDVRHAAFAWSIDGDAGAIDAFVDRGYRFDESAVLTAERVAEFPVPRGLQIRALHGDADWDAQLALGIANREAQYEAEAYARFKARQVEHHRAISARFGVWLGAFDGERLAGSCGIMRLGEGIARYQDVGVLPAYRNRGIARCLVGAAGRYALEHLHAALLVIVAHAGDFPRKIYERAGFTLSQREGALWIANR